MPPFEEIEPITKRNLKTITDIQSALESLKLLLDDIKQKNIIDNKKYVELNDKYLVGLEMVVLEAINSQQEADDLLIENKKYDLLLSALDLKEFNFVLENYRHALSFIMGEIINKYPRDYQLLTLYTSLVTASTETNTFTNASQEKIISLIEYALDKGLITYIKEYRNELHERVKELLANQQNFINIFKTNFITIEAALVKHIESLTEKHKEELNKIAILIINDNLHLAKEKLEKLITDDISITHLFDETDLSIEQTNQLVHLLNLFNHEIKQREFNKALKSAKAIISYCNSIDTAPINRLAIDALCSAVTFYHTTLTQWMQFDKGKLNYFEIINKNLSTKSASLLADLELILHFFQNYINANKNATGEYKSKKAIFAAKCVLLFEKMKNNILSNHYRHLLDIEYDLNALDFLTAEYSRLLEQESKEDTSEDQTFYFHIKNDFSKLRTKLQSLCIALSYQEKINLL